ncbi:AraC family transcriptional regulator [Xylophilus sp. GOD-11R]|uniref:AraC family transcriptional regulator n=1 Tax=Xylophilus sp. GOD-11R TaxID=3089814 RepID=UPI00298C40C0|nr:AraC family transcriptional regulator ligand-binding domain-containing protein [Xylophilus sp. GOD-11R]WPB57979.1 AraC family transcriptional regulator ligand-binding domain-containing protein [Xylophilus sp. GOD-11R]
MPRAPSHSTLTPPARAGAPAATPMAFVRAVVAAYERHAVDPSAALRQARIAPRELRLHDGRITASQFEALCAHAMQELDDEALAWFSRRLPWGSYGLLIRASVTAPDLGVALRRWSRHHRLLADDVLLHLHIDGDAATLRLEETRPIAPAVRELCLVTLLRYVHGFACWAIDSRIALRGASFALPEPRHAEVYALLFGCPLAFDAPVTAMRFDARYLALPLVRDEAATRAMLQQALALTVRQYRRDRLLAQQVREHLRQRPVATAETVAAALNLSARTLHRQLREEGSSLQSLKDEARFALAQGLLRQTARSIAQVARAAGFRNEKSFARAFTAWSGLPPGRWRQASAGH